MVVINKMDDPTVKWAKARFDECVTKIRPFLRQQCGYAVKKEVKFIPISGLSGANVKDQVRGVAWRSVASHGVMPSLFVFRLPSSVAGGCVLS